MIFRKHRGFYVRLHEAGTLISFGHRPFEGKIKKLSKILSDISATGRIAASIELDFEDKAFIKEMKL